MIKDNDISFDIKSSVGVITLNRLKSLNALTFDMIFQIDDILDQWEDDSHVAVIIIKSSEGGRSFCAGGDVKSLAMSLSDNPSDEDLDWAYEFFRREYMMNHKMFHYQKPIISLVDGIVMGGGVGISVHGSHRVVTENTLFAMPETAIGFIPDVGSGHFLGKCPEKTGMYLGLTGNAIKVEDALYAGYGTHYIPSKGIEPLFDALITADWERADALSIANAILSNYSSEMKGVSQIKENQANINTHFGHDTVEDILDSLAHDDSDWAKETLETLQSRSPLSLKLTHRHLLNVAKKTFEEVISEEYRLTCALITQPDFFEGVRAMLIDRDKSPKWHSNSVHDVSDETVDLCFKDLGSKDLQF